MNLLLLSIKGLHFFMYCELNSPLVVLLIKYTLCHLLLIIMLQMYSMRGPNRSVDFRRWQKTR